MNKDQKNELVIYVSTTLENLVSTIMYNPAFLFAKPEDVWLAVATYSDFRDAGLSTVEAYKGAMLEEAPAPLEIHIKTEASLPDVIAALKTVSESEDEDKEDA